MTDNKIIEVSESSNIDTQLSELENTIELFSHIDSDELYEFQEMPPLTYGDNSMYAEFFEDEKTLVKFIRHCVRYARSAGEYRKYMDYLIENMDFDSCYFFSNLTLDESKIAGLEIHHYPFTIFDICEIVTIKKLNNNERLSIFAIAHEVLRLHYQGKVGLVPLAKTLHEMAHDGQLYIPPVAIYGKWIDFIDEYRDFLQEHHHEKLAVLYQDYQDSDSNIARTSEKLQIIPQLWINRDNDIQRLLTTSEDTLEDEVSLEVPLDVDALFEDND